MSHSSVKHPKKHGDVKQEAEEEKKQNVNRLRESHDNSQQATLTMMAKKKMKLETSSSKHKRITKKIAGVLIHDFQPYSFVENRGFKELMEEL